MKVIKIGAAINAGCEIDGAQYCTDREADYFNFKVIVRSKKDERDHDAPILNKYEVLTFNETLQSEVKKVFEAGDFPLVLGGDHSLAIGSISAHNNQKRGIIWIDAHGDFNTDETSETKRIHGMPVANLAGLGDADFVNLVGENRVPYENIIYFGIRSLDVPEEALMIKHGLNIIRMSDIQRDGYDASFEKVFSFLKDFDSIHISFDLDSIDPQVVKGVSTPVPDGLEKNKAIGLISEIFKRFTVSSMDLVEYNPLNDDGNTIGVVLDTVAIVEEAIEGK